jgi:hypothetical protein
MARKRKPGQRLNGRLSRSKDALAERNPPPLYIIERRNLFAWAKPTPKAGEARSERDGEIDQDVCDGIGQLHILGLLDGHGIDALDLRNAGRFFGEHYWTRYRETAPKTGKYERTDKSVSGYLGETRDDRRFDRMDDVLKGYERSVLMSLVVDEAWGDGIVSWAQNLIDEALLAKGKVRGGVVMFPTLEDRARLGACIRGLCAIVDGGMEMRRAA